MAEPQPGSKVAKEQGLALAQIYNYIKNGSVVNHKTDGFGFGGKGVLVDPDEVKAAKEAASAKRGSASKMPRKSKAAKVDTDAMHDALDDEERERRARKRASGEDGNTVRLKRREVGVKYPPCPVDPAHGELTPVAREGKKVGPVKYQCWHQGHDGRPRTHPGGFAPPTQFIFTEDEVAKEQPVGKLGVIMLELVMSGRSDLSESLEAWMMKNKIEVWVPMR